MKAIILCAGEGSRMRPLTLTKPKTMLPVAGKPIMQYNIESLRENGITDIGRVGLYGLTYKENVDDMRESPTLQMLESMERHLCGTGVKVYDPFIEKDEVDGQLHSLDEFLEATDLVVLLVGHDEIKQNMDRLKGKVILDTRNICNLEGTYKL